MVYLKFALFGEGSPAKIQQEAEDTREVLFPVGAVKLFFFFFWFWTEVISLRLTSD